jgi:hypothetical protein
VLPIWSAILPYNKGIKAPPEIIMIIRADPILVNLPNPFIANGHKAGHINALANPNKAKQSTDINPVKVIAPIENITPKIAE